MLELTAGSDFFAVFSGAHNCHWISLGCHCSYSFVSLHISMSKDQVHSRILNGKFVPLELVPCTFLFIKGRKKNFPAVLVALQG